MTETASGKNWKNRLDSGAWEVSRRTVSVAGRVIDVQTDRSINGVHVKIASGSTRSSTRTGTDGHFHFLDLPDGQYTLTASLPSSGSCDQTARMEATAFRDVEGNIKKLTDGEYKARITIKGLKNEEITSDDAVSPGTGDLEIKLKSK
ncbi:MAG: carboxypeptidase regulatory-like domain-containing protein [Proteobacteria bacterium]|nr:carboxypeptidase regulatory-like domain-containing protein [Pseudomonadota bacterium]